MVMAVSPESVRRATVIHAGEALDYYSFDTPTQDTIKDECMYVADLPTLRPPFATFFVEHGRLPLEVFAYSGGREFWDKLHWETGMWHYGCLVQCVDLQAANNLPLHSGIREMVSRYCGPEAYSSRMRWLVCIYLFAASPLDGPSSKRLQGYLKQWYLPVRHDGSVLREMSGSKAAVLTTAYHPDRHATRIARIEYDATAVRCYLLPTLFAIAAMNSPHTKLDTTVSPAGVIHHLRAARLIKILENVGKAQEFGLRRAIQICKRYFARRRKERPE